MLIFRFLFCLLLTLLLLSGCSLSGSGRQIALSGEGKNEAGTGVASSDKDAGSPELSGKAVAGKDKHREIGDLLDRLKEIDEGGGKERRDDTIIFPDNYGKRVGFVSPRKSEAKGAPLEVALEFEDAPFKEVAKVILGDILGVNYTIGPGVQGKVSIEFRGNLKREDYLSVFKSLCGIYGWTLNKDGDIYQILSRDDMYKRWSPVRTGSVDETGKRFVTQVVPLKYAEPQDVVGFLRHFAMKGSLIVAPTEARVVIIVDTLENVARYYDLIDTVDVPFFAGKGIKSYDIRNLDAKTLASELEKVVFALGGGIKGKNAQLTLIPIQEANKLLVVTANPEIFPQIDKLIDNIDHLDPKGETRVFVKRIQNVKAQDVENVLKRMFLDKVSDVKRQDHIEIIADKESNMLVIRATTEDYLKMRRIFDEMDAVPNQVLIKVLIAEITLEHGEEFGIEWWAQRKLGSGMLEMSHVPVPLAATSGVLSAFFVSQDIYAFLNLVSSKTEVNVLAAPHLLVRDGRTAKVDIGKEVPLLKAVVTSEESTATKDSIDYTSVGIKLEVLPTISDQGYVTLNVKQVISDYSYSIPTLPQNPVITKREVDTSLVIGDGKTVLLAGLMQKKKEGKVEGLPWLSNIPILGYLFKSESESGSKTELMIAITSHIVKDQEQAEALTKRFEKSVKALAELQDEKSSHWN